MLDFNAPRRLGKRCTSRLWKELPHGRPERIPEGPYPPRSWLNAPLRSVSRTGSTFTPKPACKPWTQTQAARCMVNGTPFCMTGFARWVTLIPEVERLGPSGQSGEDAYKPSVHDQQLPQKSPAASARPLVRTSAACSASTSRRP